MAIDVSEKILKKIRLGIKKGKPKLQVSKEYNISYKKLLRYTKDLKTKRGISQELRRIIRQEVKNGKSKRRIAIELNLSEKTVCYHTRDICLRPFKNLRVQDRKLELMKDLLKDGYALASKKYHTLRIQRNEEAFSFGL